MIIEASILLLITAVTNQCQMDRRTTEDLNFLTQLFFLLYQPRLYTVVDKCIDTLPSK